METILGLLLILLPAIFKLVEKKLKASGKTEAAETIHEWSELFGKEEDENAEFSKNLQKVKIDHCHFGVLYV